MIHSYLVVEDAPNILNWLLANLARELPNAHAASAMNGRDALSRISERPPDLVVLDLALPEGPGSDGASPDVGFHVLGALNALPARPAVIVCSSLSMHEETLERGAAAFVSKTSSRLWPELKDQILQHAS